MSWILDTDKTYGIRMYCQGFGDCFLVNFAGETPYYVVIDCGLKLNVKDEKTKLREVVESLLEDTDRRIDLLILTHEHYDHLAGFIHHTDLWEQFSVGQVWMGWTEDEDNKLAVELDKYKEKARSLALAGLQHMSFGSEQHSHTEHLLGASVDDVRKARNFMKSLASPKPIYCNPGDVKELGNTGVTVAILGPSMNEQLLHRTEVSDEMFPKMTRNIALAAASLGLDQPTSGDYLQTLRQRLGLPLDAQKGDPNTPFSSMYRFRMSDPRWNELSRGEEIVVQEYEDLINRFRRIDTDWANGATELAMQIDSLTNNTNLSLAFRLSNHHVLLFAGDAQIGNWQSWSMQPYTFKTESGDIQLEVTDLLKQTVFYKVGHHGSQNATMRSAFENIPVGLVSMVPVEPVSNWKYVPLPSLLTDLGKKGSVVRADESNLAEAPFVQGPQSPITKRPLWVQFET
jgi:hypothetical protein